MTVVTQLAEQTVKLQALEAAQAESAKLIEQTNQVMEQVKAELVACQAERDVFKGKVADLEAKLVSEATKATEALNAEKAASAQIQQELDKAKVALDNPAYAAAAVVGSATAVAEGGSQASRTLTKEEANAEYNKITDARERAEYRKNHRKELGLED